MGLKKNIFYSSLLTGSLYFFQFITYPYISRVLGVTNVGICNYVQSIVQFFILFSTLGISALGVREIAKCNHSKEKINETFFCLFMLNALLTLVVLIVYLIAIETVTQFAPYKQLLYIGALQIVSNLFVVEWLFKGLEDFKYITLRTMIVRIIYVLAIFLFIKSPQDYPIYFFLVVGLTIINGIVNWVYRTKVVQFHYQSLSSICCYIRPLFYLGSQTLLASMFTTFNVILLGYVNNNTEVGYYTTATKIANIILALYTSFTLVMVPRISVLLEQGKHDNVQYLIKRSFDLLLAFIIPLIVFSELFTKELIYIISGPGYEGAIIPMRIIMFLILIVGANQILVSQVLMSYRADKDIFISYMIAAIIGFICNLLLVPSLHSTGAAIVWLLADTSVFIYSYLYTCKRFGNLTFFKDLLRYMLFFTPLLLFLFYIKSVIEINWLCIFIAALILTIVYSHICLFYFLRNVVYQSALRQIMKRFSNIGK